MSETSTPTDRIRKEESAKYLYSKIREEHTIEALKGLRWILIHPSGIPLDKVTTEQLISTFSYIEDLAPSKLDEAEALDLITGERITGREFLKRHRAGVYK